MALERFGGKEPMSEWNEEIIELCKEANRKIIVGYNVWAAIFKLMNRIDTLQALKDEESKPKCTFSFLNTPPKSLEEKFKECIKPDKRGEKQWVCEVSPKILSDLATLHFLEQFDEAVENFGILLIERQEVKLLKHIRKHLEG